MTRLFTFNESDLSCCGVFCEISLWMMSRRGSNTLERVLPYPIQCNPMQPNVIQCNSMQSNVAYFIRDGVPFW